MCSFGSIGNSSKESVHVLPACAADRLTQRVHLRAGRQTDVSAAPTYRGHAGETYLGSMLAALQLQLPRKSRSHVTVPAGVLCSGPPARFPNVATIVEGVVADMDTCGTPVPAETHGSATVGAALPAVAWRLDPDA